MNYIYTQQYILYTVEYIYSSLLSQSSFSRFAMKIHWGTLSFSIFLSATAQKTNTFLISEFSNFPKKLLNSNYQPISTKLKECSLNSGMRNILFLKPKNQ